MVKKKGKSRAALKAGVESKKQQPEGAKRGSFYAEETFRKNFKKPAGTPRQKCRGVKERLPCFGKKYILSHQDIGGTLWEKKRA